jgi:hypothetical protein
MRIASAFIAIAAIVTLAGCASSGATSVPAPAASASLASIQASRSAAAAAAASAIASAASAAANAPCTTNSCIVTEIDQSLTGGIAQDEAVATKVDCEKSTVKNKGGGTWTSWCTVYYSDGTSATGYGTVDTSQNKVTFEPSGD